MISESTGMGNDLKEKPRKSRGIWGHAPHPTPQKVSPSNIKIYTV